MKDAQIDEIDPLNTEMSHEIYKRKRGLEELNDVRVFLTHITGQRYGVNQVLLEFDPFSPSLIAGVHKASKGAARAKVTAVVS